MISISTSTKNRFLAALAQPAVRWAIGTYLALRIVYSAWASLVVLLNPIIVGNLDLFGTPVLAAFDLRTGERAAFSRMVDGQELHWRAAPPNWVDGETGSTWDFSGKAISGPLAGTNLQNSSYTVEDVFPYRGVPPVQNLLLSPWQRFDTNWYLKIAERGYAPDDASTVYFPLYPMLIRIVGTILLGNDLLAALLISNLAVIGVLYLLYEMASEWVGAEGAARTLVYLAVFPTAFFLFAAYTESLFLFLVLASFRMASSCEGWGRASLLAALAALTRLQGILLILPLGYMLWQKRQTDPSAISVPFRGGDGLFKSALSLFIIPLATFAFLTWQYFVAGNASLVGAYEGQLHAAFVMPWDNVAASLGMITAGRASLIDILNLFATVGFGIMLLGVWRDKTISRAYTLYAVLMYLAPLFRMTTTQPLVSMLRYVLVLFPIFILWGRWGRNPWVNRAVLYLSFPFSLYFTAQFILWGWVG